MIIPFPSSLPFWSAQRPRPEDGGHIPPEKDGLRCCFDGPLVSFEPDWEILLAVNRATLSYTENHIHHGVILCWKVKPTV